MQKIPLSWDAKIATQREIIVSVKEMLSVSNPATANLHEQVAATSAMEMSGVFCVRPACYKYPVCESTCSQGSDSSQLCIIICCCLGYVLEVYEFSASVSSGTQLESDGCQIF